MAYTAGVSVTKVRRRSLVPGPSRHDLRTARRAKGGKCLTTVKEVSVSAERVVGRLTGLGIRLDDVRGQLPTTAA